jgi:hypothetical protein
VIAQEIRAPRRRQGRGTLGESRRRVAVHALFGASSQKDNKGNAAMAALRINADMANNWRMIQRLRLALQIALILTTARWRDFSRSWGFEVGLMKSAGHQVDPRQ